MIWGLLAIIIAYLAGTWNGMVDSWLVVAAATLLMFVATGMVVWSHVAPRDKEQS